MTINLGETLALSDAKLCGSLLKCVMCTRQTDGDDHPRHILQKQALSSQTYSLVASWLSVFLPIFKDFPVSSLCFNHTTAQSLLI
jgi:hypothetical protein